MESFKTTQFAASDTQQCTNTLQHIFFRSHNNHALTPQPQQQQHARTHHRLVAGVSPPGNKQSLAVTHLVTQPTQHRPTTVSHKNKLLRKEVIQPHLPVRLPCYDFVPIADPTFDSSHDRPLASGVTNFHDVTGGVYKARERIHRSVADLRLLATPTSWGRVADPNPN